jgi:hypothetical protein
LLSTQQQRTALLKAGTAPHEAAKHLSGIIEFWYYSSEFIRIYESMDILYV